MVNDHIKWNLEKKKVIETTKKKTQNDSKNIEKESWKGRAVKGILIATYSYNFTYLQTEMLS